jgi:hypothetical protein
MSGRMICDSYYFPGIVLGVVRESSLLHADSYPRVRLHRCKAGERDLLIAHARCELYRKGPGDVSHNQFRFDFRKPLTNAIPPSCRKWQVRLDFRFRYLSSQAKFKSDRAMPKTVIFSEAANA